MIREYRCIDCTEKFTDSEVITSCIMCGSSNIELIALDPSPEDEASKEVDEHSRELFI